MDSADLGTLLLRVREGDLEARDRVFALVYDDLRRRAHFERRRGGSEGLRTTAILHEAYLKIASAARLQPEDRAHFMRIASRAMRNVVVDEARRRLAAKRGGGVEGVPLGDVQVGADGGAEVLVALDEALSRLEEKDERLARVVHLRYFVGLSVRETAEALGTSERTVKRDWRWARAHLHATLTGTDPAGEDRE
jgi:RNA polymerase sigma factor (TIGR02999 family)